MKPAIVGVQVTDDVPLDSIEEEIASVATRYGLDVVKPPADLQHEMEELRQQLEAAKEEARGYKSKFELLASLSHDLRTPLGSIIGFTELMLAYKEKRLPPKRDEVEDIRTLSHSSHQLLSVINDLVDFVKIEADKLQVYAEPFNVRSLLESVADTIQASAESPSILNIVGDPEIDVINSDSLRLRQVLVTLLMRIIKFCEEKITLAVSRENSDQVMFRIASKVGKAKYTYWGFDHGLEWPVCEGLCQLMGGTITRTIQDDALEIVIRLPMHLEISEQSE